MASADARAGERLNRFLDDLAGGGTLGVDGHVAGLDPALARAAHHLRARDDAPNAHPDFADRLLGDILANADLPRGQTLPRRPAAAPRWPRRSPLESLAVGAAAGRWPRPRWAVAQLATAALLLLTIVSSFVAFGPGRYRQQEKAPAFVPATSVAPSESPEVARLLWESRGDVAQPINNPGHLAIAPDGNLWVTDGMRNRFQIIAPDGAYVGSWGTAGTGEGQFELNGGGWPFGAAAFDRAGNLYVADTGNYRVQKFGPDRSFILAWGSKGRRAGEFLWPDNLAIDQQGRVYVLDGARDDIQVFEADGSYVKTIGAFGVAEGQFMFFDNGGLTVDRTGNLWVADISNQRVQEFSPDGAFLKSIGGYGFSPGKFASPNGAAVDAAGRLFVLDVGLTGTRIQIFAPDGAYLAAWSVAGGRPADLSTSGSLTLDGKGNLYVVDYVDDRILKLRLLPPFAPAAPPDQAATTDLLWQYSGDNGQKLDHPAALEIAPDGRLWVADTKNSTYQILSAEGAYLESWGRFGSEPGELNLQTADLNAARNLGCDATGGISFTPDGSFYLADGGNHRVQKFGPDREFLFAWGSKGVGDGQFSWVTDVALDSQGLVYVTDAGRNNIQVFTSDGTFLRTIGIFGGGQGELNLYGGGFSTVDDRGHIWVTDVSNNRLQQFSVAGDSTAMFGRYGMAPGQFSSPGQVAIDNAGRLFVADGSNHRVQVFAPDGTFVMALGAEGIGPIYTPKGVALDDAGNVYVSDYDEDRVLAFRLVSPLPPAATGS